MKQLVYGTLLAALCLGTAAWAAPEPMVVQKSGLWTADVSFEPLKTLIWKPTPDGPAQRYWYTILTITNGSRQDIPFYSRCDLLTDTFQLVPAISKIPRPILQRLKRLHQKKYPLLQAMSTVGNRILQGEDHAVDVLILWPDFDPQATRVKLYITGLSNETAMVEHPTAKNADGQSKQVFLRKTLELTFALQSQADFRTKADVAYKGKRWVMR